MIKLGVNIDHIATLRQARYRNTHQSPLAEPSPLDAAKSVIKAGVKSITIHLREDRRHIQDSDLFAIRNEVHCLLNLEMAATPLMTDIALKIKPQEVCLVPENRKEITTEGGLDVLSQKSQLFQTVTILKEANIPSSFFIDPELEQVKASADLGAEIIELHTGAYANALSEEEQKKEFRRHFEAATLGASLGLQVNAGHGLNYSNLIPFIQSTPHLHTLNIGHSIVSRALLVGLENAVLEMRALIEKTFLAH